MKLELEVPFLLTRLPTACGEGPCKMLEEKSDKQPYTDGNLSTHHTNLPGKMQSLVQ